jgi:hypothetical protein
LPKSNFLLTIGFALALLLKVQRRLLFLGLIGLMLLVLAIAGSDRSRLQSSLLGAPAQGSVEVLSEAEIDAALASRADKGRSPASVPRKLDIEPVFPGGE